MEINDDVIAPVGAVIKKKMAMGELTVNYSRFPAPYEIYMKAKDAFCYSWLTNETSVSGRLQPIRDSVVRYFHPVNPLGRGLNRSMIDFQAFLQHVRESMNRAAGIPLN